MKRPRSAIRLFIPVVLHDDDEKMSTQKGSCFDVEVNNIWSSISVGIRYYGNLRERITKWTRSS